MKMRLLDEEIDLVQEATCVMARITDDERGLQLLQVVWVFLSSCPASDEEGTSNLSFADFLVSLSLSRFGCRCCMVFPGG
jgi:hypothetical protein